MTWCLRFVLCSLVFGAFFAPVSAQAQYVGHVSEIVVDANSGVVIAAQDANLQRYPASLTKLMTLYLAFKALNQGTISLRSRVPVSIHAASMEPSKLGLVPGARFTVEQAILGLVTKSANDAASALGEFLGGGSEVAFANAMTREARRLGMNNTTFHNASGLPDPQQVTTARDLAILTRHLILDYPQYFHYFSTKNFRFRGRLIPNHNPMLGEYIGADGLKTGYTALAGHNLITSANRQGQRVVGVILGARTNLQRNRLMVALLDQGFASVGISPLPLRVNRTEIAVASRWRGRGHVRRHHAVVSRSSDILEVADAPSGPRRFRGVHRRADKLSHRRARRIRPNVRMVTSRHFVSRRHLHKPHKG